MHILWPWIGVRWYIAGLHQSHWAQWAQWAQPPGTSACTKVELRSPQPFSIVRLQEPWHKLIGCHEQIEDIPDIPSFHYSKLWYVTLDSTTMYNLYNCIVPCNPVKSQFVSNCCLKYPISNLTPTSISGKRNSHFDNPFIFCKIDNVFQQSECNLIW